MMKKSNQKEAAAFEFQHGNVILILNGPLESSAASLVLFSFFFFHQKSIMVFLRGNHEIAREQKWEGRWSNKLKWVSCFCS